MNERNKEKKGFGIFKTIFIVLLCAIILYVVFQVVMVLNPSIKTRTAIRYDLNDSITCMALMSMPQEEITYGGGVPDYLIKNGDRVASGGEIARIFSSSEQAQSYAQAQRASTEASLLKTAQIRTPGVNIESLLLQTKTSLFSIIDKADKGAYLSIEDEKEKYQSSVNKTQIATGKAQNFDERINALAVQETSMIEASGETTVIYAPNNGYFVSNKFSQAQQYTADELAAMSPVQLKEASESAPIIAGENVLGRLIYDYRWNCYLSVSLEQSKKFIEGKTVYLVFNEISLNQIPAKIVSINKDEALGIAKITLSGDYMTADIAAVQHTQATVIFPSSYSTIPYTGIRVPKEALRAVNGEYGVYIRYGNLAQYKRIQILFEDENYILAPLTYEKNVNELKMYDEIIIEGRGLLPKQTDSEPKSKSQGASQSEESISKASSSAG